MIVKFISWFVTKIKHEEFKFDKRIPIIYFLSFTLKKIIALFRGVLVFRSMKKVFLVGSNAKILCSSKIYAQGPAIFAENCYLDALSIEGVTLGKNFSLGRGGAIECTGSLKLLGVGFTAGNNVGIGSFSYIGAAGGVRIGDDTIFGNFVSIHSENHCFDNPDIPIRIQGVSRQGVIIGHSCWIGAKATILDGACLGNNIIVAAGAVVTQGDYEDFVILAGVPAKVVGTRKK